jgi:hypothetical protein
VALRFEDAEGAAVISLLPSGKLARGCSLRVTFLPLHLGFCNIMSKFSRRRPSITILRKSSIPNSFE